MKAQNITTEQFKELVFDYTKQQEWKFEGDKPAIIDFYADWCGPCKMVAPILDELAKEYDGKIDIYKVDTEVEQELSAVFQIRSIPSMLFIPKGKQPMMNAGALPKHVLKDVIEKDLLKNKKAA
ncbi:MAG: thioredoxin [Schleiferiaceae bacterium]|nr:thioredoxin [Schleiferiaceae bacterium]